MLSGLLLPHKLHRGKRKRLQIISLSSFSPLFVVLLSSLPPFAVKGKGGIGGGGRGGSVCKQQIWEKEKEEKEERQ